MIHYEPIEPVRAPKTSPLVLTIAVSHVLEGDTPYVRAQLGETVVFRRGALARARAIGAALEAGVKRLAEKVIAADLLLRCGVEVRVVES